MSQRKESNKVKRTWEERQEACMRNKQKIVINIMIIILVLIELLFVYSVILHILKDNVKVQAIESNISINDIYIGETKKTKATLYLDTNPFIKVEIIFRQKGEYQYYRVTNNLDAFYLNFCLVGIILIAILLYEIEKFCYKYICYIICFAIFLFTEMMSRLEKRRKP